MLIRQADDTLQVFLLWLLILPFAVANGALREAVLILAFDKSLGKTKNHMWSTFAR
ncbi:hypothetical protein [Noviherbaspirillum galbum]|uniref:Uncharacterized protein n=1 Tax=Noviherbaspirillum galbum TaxID=2709383 RepID=A0A6B3STC3_9BURK|nr:hypothetical protein [Noviherbaspirillum galbum]NEX62086.1 hypothetical protein [Noviherbaspirillum galbum]